MLAVSDKDEKSKLLAKWSDESLPNFVKNAETVLESRGGKYFAGGKVLRVKQSGLE